MNNSSVVVSIYMRGFIASVGLVLLVCMANAAAQQANASLHYVNLQQVSSDALVVDTRARVVCEHRSFAGARCLPATDLLGPDGELPSFADIFWALGTAGIDGSETILVIGDKPLARDFVAGLLYLCGQARVEILNSSIEKGLRTGLRHAGQGRPRGILRQRIYHARMRDELLVLPAELSAATNSTKLVIPVKASNYLTSTPSLSELKSNRGNEAKDNKLFVIYARQPRDAIALFARLLAITPKQDSGIRVMPVAQPGLFGQPVNLHIRGMKPSFIAIVTRGEKQWT